MIPSTFFRFENSSSGAKLQLLEKKRFLLRTSERTLPYNDWPTKAPTYSIGAIAELELRSATIAEPLIEELEITPQTEILSDNRTVLVPHHIVAELSDEQAVSLGMPTTLPLTLHVAQNGPLTDDKTQLTATWTEESGRPIALRRLGAFAQVGESLYRLPHSLYKTATAIDSFNGETSPDINIRLAHLAHLKNVSDNSTDNVIFEHRLESTKFSHATSFSLEESSEGSDFDFNPVLFGPEDMQGNRKKLLSNSEQQLFSKRGFKKWLQAAASYFISNEHYLFVDPNLLPALNIVREVQQANTETKKDFLRNPAHFIRDTLIERGEIIEDDEYRVDGLFTETEAYSDRVIEIGLWDPPSLPNEKLNDEPWVPREIEKRPKEDAPDNDVETTTTDDAPTSHVPVTIDNVDPDELYVDHGKEEQHYNGLEIPAGLTSSLRDHQNIGLLWLQRCWKKGMPGALLADDMGVGKTIQAVTFLRWLIDTGEKNKHGQLMVVAPVSLLENWQNEIETHLDRQGLGSLALLYGSGLKKFRNSRNKDIKSGSPELDLASINGFDILLTTYETLRDYSISLARLELSCVVFDEMQKVKNPVSLMTKASKALNATFTLGLTGTPIENSTADLWCIMDTLLPGRLGARSSFLLQYGPSANQDTLNDLGIQLTVEHENSPPPILRRMKSDIGADLPIKTIERLPLKMPPQQCYAYDQILETANISGKGTALALIQQLRSVSLYPSSPTTEQKARTKDLAYIENSARMIAAFKALDSIHKRGEKALIFVENLSVAAHLALLIRRRYNLPHTPARIYGATPATKRQEIVNTFSNSPAGVFDVLVLSPKAAGVGLNIVAANHVIHLTRWWNPAVEDQCTDRAYRIKQDKPVTVYIPLSTHEKYPGESFDEKLDSLLEKKRSISNNLFIGCETGTEANALAKELLAATKIVGTQHSSPAQQEPQNELSDYWSAALKFTTYPPELQELKNANIPVPEIGIDIQNSTDEVIAQLEWAWPDCKIGLVDTQHLEEQQRAKSIENLQALGWKLVFDTKQESLHTIEGWLKSFV